MTVILLLLALAQDPAVAAAEKLPIAQRASHAVRLAAQGVKDPALRSAVEAQLAAPWLPPEAWAYAHAADAAKLLRERGMLDGALELPLPGKGRFNAAPGGPCEDGHHGYPGGLAVHTWANLLHARALSQVYREVYQVKLRDDVLVAAAIWHDSLKAATLPFRDDGSCGPEPKIAGTPLHHILGIAAAMLRHLPPELVLVIASAHTPPTAANEKTVCGWIEAASILANGVPGECPRARPIEAFVNHFSDADFPFTVEAWTSYIAKAPKGWARYDALLQDESDVAMWERRQR